jgi:hypothetical protein
MKITNLLGAEKNPTLSLVYPCFFQFIQRQFSGGVASQLATAIQKDLKRRITPWSSFLQLCCLVDPRRKHLSFLSDDSITVIIKLFF